MDLGKKEGRGIVYCKVRYLGKILRKVWSKSRGKEAWINKFKDDFKIFVIVSAMGFNVKKKGKEERRKWRKIRIKRNGEKREEIENEERRRRNRKWSGNEKK